MRRKQDWPKRLDAYIRQTEGAEFAWGAMDCVSWAFGAVNAVTCFDPVAQWRGTYSTEIGAMTVIYNLTGTTSVEALVEKICTDNGMDEVSPLLAHRGDIVIADSGHDGPMVGVVGMSGLHAIFRGKEKMETYPLRSCSRAWRVG